MKWIEFLNFLKARIKKLVRVLKVWIIGIVIVLGVWWFIGPVGLVGYFGVGVGMAAALVLAEEFDVEFHDVFGVISWVFVWSGIILDMFDVGEIRKWVFRQRYCKNPAELDFKLRDALESMFDIRIYSLRIDVVGREELEEDVEVGIKSWPVLRVLLDDRDKLYEARDDVIGLISDVTGVPRDRIVLCWTNEWRYVDDSW